ncbi:hypothetical protein LJC29_01515 [Bacteroides sp. OttesenSCG-928-N06]|nr:hypothetical protein [Bacteroides sp. OttesenSCG-928-N06]
MTKKTHNYWTEERCAEEALKFTRRVDFEKHSSSACQTARRKGWMDRICSHMELTVEQKKTFFSYYENCHTESKKYRNRKEFRAKNNIAYKIAQSKGWLDFFFENPKSVPIGWWQDKSHCLEEALKYNQRTSFAHSSAGAFQAAFRNGWLDEICKHMDDYQRENGTYKRKSGYWTKERCIKAVKECVNNGESKQQFKLKYSAASRAILQNGWTEEIYSMFPILGNLYRRCIYVYEFTDNFAYIGLTYNPTKRNRDHHYKKDSAVYKHIHESGLFPTFKVISDYMENEEAQKQEASTLKEYINNGWNILNRIKTGALGHGNPIWTKEICQQIASKYIVLKDFSDNEPICYNAMIRNGWVKELCLHMKRRKFSLNEMKIAAAKYDTVLDFRRNDNKIYCAAQRQGLLNEVIKGMKAGYDGPSESEIRAEACKYTLYGDFINKSKLHYKWAKRLGILDKVTSHMNRSKRKKITFSMCKITASKCTSRVEFKKMDPSAYSCARENGWLEELCAHMKPMIRTFTYESLQEIANKYKTKKDFQKKDSSAYNSAYRRGWLDDLCVHMIKKKRKPYTLEECAATAEKYNTRVDFQKKSMKCYNAARRNGWLDIVCSHMKPMLREITKDVCFEIAKRCTTRAEFQRMDGSCYNAARKNGWLNEICEHMKPQHRKITKELCLEIAKEYKTRSEFQKKDSSCYNVARVNGWLDEIFK